MDDADERLDGNAAAGPLREIFAGDVTAARVRCASCGHVATIGAAHAYMGDLAPGVVLRCERCEAVLLVLVEHAGRRRLGTPGTSWIELG